MIKWIRKLFSKTQFKSKLDPEQEKVVDQTIYDNTILLQRSCDQGWDNKIKAEAQRLFEEWKDSRVVSYDGKVYNIHIPVVNFYTGVYMIYNQQTAKYKTNGQHAEVVRQYQERIEKYESEQEKQTK